MGNGDKRNEAAESQGEADVSKYFPLAHWAIENLKAEAVVLFVVNGIHGHGCAPAFRYALRDTPEAREANTRLIRTVATAMRAIADRVEADARAAGVPLEPLS